MLRHIEDKVDKFNKEGFIHLKNVIPKDILSETRNRAITLNKFYRDLIGQDRHNGSGKFWGGLELASTLDPNLWKFYTADFMYEIASKFLNTSKPYLFNDQVVVKLPNDELKFEPHYDNQFGPDPDGALQNEFKTINCSWILTNMPEDTGPLWCQNALGHFSLIEAKAGDIVIIDGNTIHYSGKNVSNSIRALYACVYSNKPIGNFQKGFYNEEFYK